MFDVAKQTNHDDLYWFDIKISPKQNKIILCKVENLCLKIKVFKEN